MKIVNNLLLFDNDVQATFVKTPNKAGNFVAKYLVIHYTAATTASSSVNWFKNPNAKASAHLLIDRDGNITQFAAFNEICWHAGQSRWNGIEGLLIKVSETGDELEQESDGSFVVNHLATGEYNLQVSAPGYMEKTILVLVKLDNYTYLTVEMELESSATENPEDKAA